MNKKEQWNCIKTERKESHLQNKFYQDLFYISISNHTNGLASNIEFRCHRKKQDKRLSNHHLSPHLYQKTKHHSGDPHYSTSKWYSINFQCVFGMQLIREGGGGEIINKYIGDAESTLSGFLTKTFTKIKVHASMAERLVRYLATEEALYTEVQGTLEHKNKSYVWPRG